MPETLSASRPSFAAIARPHCPQCNATMTLVRIARGPSGFDIRTFDCATCDHAQIVTVATDPMKSDKIGWLLAAILRLQRRAGPVRTTTWS